MSHPNAQNRPFHALQHDRVRFLYFHRAPAALEPFRLVVLEEDVGRRLGGDGPADPSDEGHELAAVAHAQAERVGTGKEPLELVLDLRVE